MLAGTKKIYKLHYKRCQIVTKNCVCVCVCAGSLLFSVCLKERNLGSLCNSDCYYYRYFY